MTGYIEPGSPLARIWPCHEVPLLCTPTSYVMSRMVKFPHGPCWGLDSERVTPVQLAMLDEWYRQEHGMDRDYVPLVRGIPRHHIYGVSW